MRIPGGFLVGGLDFWWNPGRFLAGGLNSWWIPGWRFEFLVDS